MEGGLTGAHYTNGKAGRRFIPHESNLKSPVSNGQYPDRIRFGVCNVYGSSLPCFSAFTRPLNSMVKKNAEIDWGSPTKEQIKAL